jgi:hypothetical protein
MSFFKDVILFAPVNLFEESFRQDMFCFVFARKGDDIAKLWFTRYWNSTLNLYVFRHSDSHGSAVIVLKVTIRSNNYCATAWKVVLVEVRTEIRL